MDILCVVGYGPQIGDSIDRKSQFWEYLEQEVETAREHDFGLIIQIDSNAWAGQHINPKDPNPQNANGKLLQQFLQSNPALTVVNSLQSCEGSITRHRKTTAGEENSVLSTRATFTDQVSSFEKTMNQIYHQAFPKICEKKRKFKEDNVGYLVEKKENIEEKPKF